ncbi:response regulator transcription factor [Saccharothrix texasensis]|uniref:Regulatory LuxR family protein n=1 Tax=Saccharothrix texasensis TaxID=103734 RepID=A0A3N1GZM0_9PSEU|nr:response regulator transcription factor [Saccharothrix texasensis]ROP35750.1 regulatory LuxR family protein [Saccharothrix texasensis]
MGPVNPEEVAGGDLTMEQLIQLARAHQDLVQELLGQLSDKWYTIRPDAAGEDDYVVRWKFTAREDSVARLLVEGFSNRRIARRLGISERTVKNHLQSIFHKLGVGDRTRAVIKLIRHM